MPQCLFENNDLYFLCDRSTAKYMHRSWASSSCVRVAATSLQRWRQFIHASCPICRDYMTAWCDFRSQWPRDWKPVNCYGVRRTSKNTLSASKNKQEHRKSFAKIGLSSDPCCTIAKQFVSQRSPHVGTSTYRSCTIVTQSQIVQSLIMTHMAQLGQFSFRDTLQHIHF